MKATVMILILNKFIASQEVVTTSTAQGLLYGSTANGYISYYGIPYASLNNTNGRFKSAGPAPAWSGIRELRRERISCYQTHSGSEDCLELDVYVPSESTSTLWPVLVWIQGGPGQYNPTRLVTKGLILVAVSYRVGPMGFLCLNNERAPGNAGAKDIVLALSWVRDNIVAFRGDPAKVTVAGHSFGAALVEALILSPIHNNLFHGAIIQSGSVLCPWSFNYDAEARAKALVQQYTDSDDEKEMTNALIKAKAGDLTQKSNKLNLSYFPFAMCIEGPHKKEEQLISQAPISIMKTKSYRTVPMVIGYNNNEAYIFASYLKNSNALRKLKKDASLLLPEELNFRNEKEVKQIVRELKSEYFIKNISYRTLLEYYRDAYFVSHIHRSVKLHSTRAPVYYYQFSYNGNLGIEEEDDIKKDGAAHSDELSYLFTEDGIVLNGDDATVQNNLLTLWSNFVKHLHPNQQQSPVNVHWDPVNENEPRILNIGVEMEMKNFPYSRTAKLWDDIYEKYYYRRQE